MPIVPTVLGTDQHDLLTDTTQDDVIIALGGDDTVQGTSGADVIYGDYLPENLLTSVAGAVSLSDYGATGAWQVSEDSSGLPVMTQSVTTLAGATYEVSFELAANYVSGTSAAVVTVLWNGTEIGSAETTSAIFSEAVFSFVGTGEPGDLSFHLSPLDDPNAPELVDTGVVNAYSKTVTIGDADVELLAFAEGQPKIYQVMNGKLHIFDPETETYTAAGAEATVVVNSIGFNVEDDLIYGVAVSSGVDHLGNAVSNGDLVMYDALGQAYRIGDTPYRSWTGDFDDKGNLWYFESDLDRITIVDVDQLDETGNPQATTLKFPQSMVSDKIWDVAYDAEAEAFFGLVRPDYEGASTTLVRIDVAGVTEGAEPVVTTINVTHSLINGQLVDGVPAITFGAFMIDAEGNMYAGGNGGDHDMNDGTGSSGAIYRVDLQTDGTATLVLVADAPKAYSNDGAVDPRAMDPFQPVDPSAIALIRGPELYVSEDPAESYNDSLSGGAGADEVHGGYAEDVLIGASSGDTLSGGTGDDMLWGGNGADKKTWITSFYDEIGQRFDQHGTLLAEDDDVIFGGAGDDFLDGSAGHDALDGGAGQDTLSGGSGHDTLSGGAENDLLRGGGQNDLLSGGAGSDDLSGGSGNDTLSGGTNDDTLHGGSQDDVLSGGDGSDELDGGSGSDTLDGGDGSDLLSGGSGDDVLSGDVGADTLRGGSGDDHLQGGSEDDRLNGGSGSDTLSGGDGADYIKAGSGSDHVTGEDGNDYINAGSGDDVLDGGAGKDRLYLGGGDDIATGGADSDRFIFRNKDIDGSTDIITDFTRDDAQSDMLDFRRLNLLDGTTEALWIAANVVALENTDVSVDLGQGTTLLLQNSTNAADFFSDVEDGFIF